MEIVRRKKEKPQALKNHSKLLKLFALRKELQLFYKIQD